MSDEQKPHEPAKLKSPKFPGHKDRWATISVRHHTWRSQSAKRSVTRFAAPPSSADPGLLEQRYPFGLFSAK